jgi:hypothetical protein
MRQVQKNKRPISFGILNSAKDGLYSRCKACKAEDDKTYREKNKDKLAAAHKVSYNSNKEAINKYKKEWYGENKPRILLKRKTNYENNRVEILAAGKIWREKNTDKKKEIDKKYAMLHKADKKKYDAEYRQINKKSISEKTKARRDQKIKEGDVQFILSRSLRRCLRRAIKGNKKIDSISVKDFGCSSKEVKEHLESQFYKNNITGEEMSWDNYGKKWQIDHIVPLCVFSLNKIEHFLKACNYTNLQPLWKEDHIRKTAMDISVERKQMLKDLIKLADMLDEKGFHSESTAIDGVIKSAGEHNRAVIDFANTLRQALDSVSKNKNILPRINKESLPEILQVIDAILNRGSFIGPSASQMPDKEGPAVVAEGIAALTADYERIEKEIESEKDDSIVNDLYKELKELTDRLSNLYKTVKSFKDGREPGDKEKYEQIKQIVNSKLGREVLK